VEPVPDADVPDADHHHGDYDADDNYYDADNHDHHHGDYNPDDDHDADDHDADDYGAHDDSGVADVDRHGHAETRTAGDAGACVHPGARVHATGGARVHATGRAGLHAACGCAGTCTRSRASAGYYRVAVGWEWILERRRGFR
jgi:hypothetical protein